MADPLLFGQYTSKVGGVRPARSRVDDGAPISDKRMLITRGIRAVHLLQRAIRQQQDAPNESPARKMIFWMI